MKDRRTLLRSGIVAGRSFRSFLFSTCVLLITLVAVEEAGRLWGYAQRNIYDSIYKSVDGTADIPYIPKPNLMKVWARGHKQFVKWPYLIMAFFDLILDHQFSYVITSKISVATPKSLALWSHIPTLILIGLAWGIGLSIHETVPVEVQFCAGTVVITTLALLATEKPAIDRTTGGLSTGGRSVLLRR